MGEEEKMFEIAFLKSSNFAIKQDSSFLADALKPRRVLLRATGQYELTSQVFLTFHSRKAFSKKYPNRTHGYMYEGIYYRISRNEN